MSNRTDFLPLAQAQKPLFLGIDLGGTNIKIGLVDDNGATIGQTSVPTCVTQGPDLAVHRIGEASRKLVANYGLSMAEIAYIGLGSPGTMDIPAGMLLEPPNLHGWWNYPLKGRVQDACGRPVAFANDANAAAFGECWIGSGKQFHSIVLLTLGTGVGGGIIIGDLSVDGENSHGSECGHIIIDYNENARVCSCNQLGHLEAYASATAVVKRTEEALAAGRSSSIIQRIAVGEAISTLMLMAEAEAGDALSLELIMETAKYLGIAAASLAHTIDPGAIILGGAMNFGGHQHALGRQFLERVRLEFRQRAFPVLARRTTIDFASLGGDAGYIGVAGIARTAYKREASNK